MGYLKLIVAVVEVGVGYYDNGWGLACKAYFI